MWYLYLVRCADGCLYTGISTDVSRRLAEHRNNRGARRLRGRGPLELVFQTAVGDRGSAQRVEYRVKRLDRHAKQALVDGRLALADLDDRVPPASGRAATG
jgi:putative endonuclease